MLGVDERKGGVVCVLLTAVTRDHGDGGTASRGCRAALG